MPPQTSIANRRLLILIISAIGILSLLSVFFRSAPQRRHFPSGDPLNHLNINPEVLKGEAIAGKIANETIKYTSTFYRLIFVLTNSIKSRARPFRLASPTHHNVLLSSPPLRIRTIRPFLIRPPVCAIIPLRPMRLSFPEDTEEVPTAGQWEKSGRDVGMYGAQRGQ